MSPFGLMGTCLLGDVVVLAGDASSVDCLLGLLLTLLCADVTLLIDAAGDVTASVHCCGVSGENTAAARDGVQGDMSELSGLEPASAAI